MQIKLTFTTKVLHLDSFWEWESQELRNGPLKAMGITWPTLKEFPSMFVFNRKFSLQLNIQGNIRHSLDDQFF